MKILALPHIVYTSSGMLTNPGLNFPICKMGTIYLSGRTDVRVIRSLCMQKHWQGGWHWGSTNQCWQIIIIALLHLRDFLETEDLPSFQEFTALWKDSLLGAYANWKNGLEEARVSAEVSSAKFCNSVHAALEEEVYVCSSVGGAVVECGRAPCLESEILAVFVFLIFLLW